MNNTMYQSTPVLPWDRSAEEERLFRKLAAIFGVIFLVLCLILAFFPLPEKKREQVERIPPRLAKLVMEKQKPPPPPPPPKEEPKIEEPKPEEPKKEEPKKEEPKKEEPKKEEPKKEPPKKTAREKARAHMAAFDDLADLRDTQDLAELKAEQNVSASGAGAQTAPTQRSLIGTNAVGGSGGVAVSKASSGGGGTGSLNSANVSSTKVESSIANPAQQQAEKRSAGGKSRRTTEDVQLIFDRNKGSIYSLYRRALRENPALEGTLVLRLEIQPDGSVSKCEVVSSQLNDPDLERKIVVKVRQINFGRMDVEVWRDTYPITFIPS